MASAGEELAETPLLATASRVLKGAAAKVNMELGVMDAKVGNAVVQVRRVRACVRVRVSVCGG